MIANDAGSRLRVRSNKGTILAISLPRAICGSLQNSSALLASPHQHVTTNAVTGKAALGPWLGPFNAHPADSVSRPSAMYLDTQGTCYLGLDAEQHSRLIRSVREAQEGSGMLCDRSPTTPGTNSSAISAALLASLLAARGPHQPKRAHAAGLKAYTAANKGPCMQAMLRRTRHINQPRRSN